MEDEGRVNPRSDLVRSVSDRVFMTVRKMATLRGSPWYTPIFSGTGGDDHSSAEMVADKPEYTNSSSLENSGGA